MAHPNTLFAPHPPQRDLGPALSLTPSERSSAVEAFFQANPGPGRAAPGLGRAIRDFLDWQAQSGRIAESGGSRWWRAVNGAMVLDLLAAMAGSGEPAPRAWRAYGAGAGNAQAALWQAHQLSLHTGIRRSQRLLENEPAPERAFANIVIDIVAGRPLPAVPPIPASSPPLSSGSIPRSTPFARTHWRRWSECGKRRPVHCAGPTGVCSRTLAWPRLGGG